MSRPPDLLLTVGAAMAVALAVAFGDSSFHVVPAASGTWRGVTQAPGAGRILAALACGALAAVGLARAAAAVRRPVLVLAVAAAPLLPVATGVLRPLLVFQGPVLRLVAAAVVAVALFRLARASSARFGDAPGVLLFAAAFAFYAAWGTRVPGPAGPQGDEPHYLVIAQSLLSDGDVELSDEFADREYAPFYGGTLDHHRSPNAPPGTHYSIHSPGFPALLVPAYALGGYPGVRLFLSALAALAGVLVHRLVRDVSGRPDLAAGSWALFVFTPPLPFYAVTVYPETLATVVIVAYLLLARGQPHPARAAAAAAIAVVLPWVHTKFVPVGVLGLFFTLVRPYSWRVRLAGGAALLLSVGGLLLHFRAVYGQASLLAALGPVDVDLRRVPWGTGGLFFDRQYGLLAVAPVLALAAAGFPALWRERTGDALRALALGVLPVVPSAAYVDWWGGACPPARYVLPVIGPLALFAAAALARAPGFAAAAGGIGVAVLAFAADVPRALRNRPDGESLLLRLLSPAVDLNGWLPSFVQGGPGAPLLALSLAAGAVLAWRWRWRGLFAAVALHAAAVAAVEGRPVVDQRAATERLLWEWDQPAGRSAALRGLELPVELPRRPWTFGPGEIRNSRRLHLPPGAYRVRVRLREITAPAAVRLSVHAGPLTLGEWDVLPGAPGTPVPLLLPLGGRGLGVTAMGLSGEAEVEAVIFTPEALVPPARRAGFDWPVLAEQERYRAGRSELRVTLQDRSAREGDVVRVDGEAALLLDAPAGATIEVRVTREDGSAGEIEWGARRVPLPAEAVSVIDLPMAEGVDLGTAAVLPVRIRLAAGRVTFALKGR